MNKKLITLISISLLLLQLAQAQEINDTYTSDVKKIKDKICLNAAEKTGDKSLTNNSNEESVQDLTDQAKDWDFLKDAADGKNYLRKYLYRNAENGDSSFDEQELLMAVGQDIAPLLLLLVLSILGWILYIICYCMDCICPKCICCKKNDQEHFSKFEMRWPIFGIFLFSLLIVVSSIFGLFQGANFTDGFYIITCRFTNFIDEFNSQNENLNWYGLEKLKSKISVVGEDFHQRKEETFSLSSNNDDNEQQQNQGQGQGEGEENEEQVLGEIDLDGQYNKLSDESIRLWRDHYGDDEQAKDQYKYTNIPFYYGQENNGQTEITSIFYTTIWGPITEEGRHTYNIDQIVKEPLRLIKEGIQDASDQAQQMDTSDIDDVISDGIVQIEKFQKELKDLAQQIEDETDTLEENILPSIKTGVNWYFIVSIILSALSFVGAFLVYCTRLYKIRVCIHISWCLISIWMIVGFALATGLYTTSLLGVQSCEIIDDIKKDPKYLKDLDVVNDDIMDKLNTCKTGDKWSGTGDILSHFNIQQQLDDIRSLGTDVQKSVDTNTKELDNFKEIDNYLKTAITHLEQLNNNGYFEQDDIKSYEIIYSEGGTKRNGLSKQDDNEINYTCASGLDIFDGQYTTEKNEICSGSPNTIFEILSGSQTCGNIHQYYQDEVSISDSQNNHSGCNHLNQDLKWVKEKNELTQRKLKQLKEFQEDMTAYKEYIENWVAKIRNFDGEVNKVFNSIDVVLANVDCRFVGSNIDSILNVVCDTAIPDIYWLGMSLIINSVFLFFGSIFMVCAGYRFANVFPKEKKQKAGKSKNREDKYKVAETKTQD